MPENATVDQLFELAIAAEEAAEALYQGLAAKFANHPQVAAFWEQYAREERLHAAWQQRFRKSLPPEALETAADPLTLQRARRSLELSVDHALAEIKDLEDAYRLVNDLENSEINAVFSFLIDNFATNEEIQDFLRSQLHNHIMMLMQEFPEEYSTPGVRRRIKVAA
ncbi:MAG: ferritin family protein [Anaerolineales bacterium]